jgi:hypothetical protein
MSGISAESSPRAKRRQNEGSERMDSPHSKRKKNSAVEEEADPQGTVLFSP